VSAAASLVQWSAVRVVSSTLLMMVSVTFSVESVRIIGVSSPALSNAPAARRGKADAGRGRCLKRAQKRATRGADSTFLGDSPPGVCRRARAPNRPTRASAPCCARGLTI